MDTSARSSWPVVIGVIAILLGCLGGLGAIGGMMMPFLADSMAAMTSPSPSLQTAQWQAMRDHMPLILASNGVYLLLAALLVVTGILFLRRRPVAASAARFWAIAKMLGSVLGVVSGYLLQTAQFQAMQGTPGAPPMSPGFINAFALGGLIIGLLWAWALPVFMLIWLSRPTIRREVAGWG